MISPQKYFMTKPIFLFFILIVLTLFSSCIQLRVRSTEYAYREPAMLSDSLKTDNLYRVGIDSNKIIKLTKNILADSFPNIHSLLIARSGKLVCESYFSGKDQNWGWPLGYVEHDVNSLHDTRSISKSVVAACVSIAIGQQKIKSIDDPFFNYLPEYSQYRTPQNSRVTIRHLLTMSSGMKWDEDVPHGTSKNNETQMERSADPVAYVLKQPIVHEPGSVWQYNSGGVQILAAIIKNVSGNAIDKFAGKYLFLPLGIETYHWTRIRGGFPAAASGLRLTSRDLLKFGVLFLNNGKWNNRQILSEEWVNDTFKSQISRNSLTKMKGYSYLFWTDTDTVSKRPYAVISAKGNGGQRIFLAKELNLVVVITAGNYNKMNIVYDGHRALIDYIIPAVIEPY